VYSPGLSLFWTIVCMVKFDMRQVTATKNQNTLQIIKISVKKDII